MSTAFTIGALDLHAHPDAGEAAVYAPVGGGSVATSIIRSRHDKPAEFAELQVRHAGWSLELLQADVPTRPTAAQSPNDADHVTVGGTTYYIRDVEEDAQRTVWRCDVTEVPA